MGQVTGETKENMIVECPLSWCFRFAEGSKKKIEQVVVTTGQGVRAEMSKEGTAGHIRTSGQAFQHEAKSWGQK